MRSREIPGTDELPPEEHAIGVYIGLAAGALVLGIGGIVLFRSILYEVSTEGLKFTTTSIFRLVLMIASVYASIACFFALRRLVGLQQSQVKKVDEEFKDFVIYARPLVEEIIRQRVVGERISERLDQLYRLREMEGDKGRVPAAGAPTPGSSKWQEFLLFAALLANISIGLFIYLERHPWRLVPYSVVILAIAWWFLLAKYFELLHDVKTYYIPAIFILLLPTLSIILRAFMEPFRVLFLVFAALFVYIVIIYIYFKYLVTGELPTLAPSQFEPVKGRARNGEVSEKLSSLLPPPKPKLEKNNNSKLLEELLPTNNKKSPEEMSLETEREKGRMQRLKDILPGKKSK